MREIDMGSYTVELIEVGRMSRLRYVEGERTLIVETEMLAATSAMAVNATDIGPWETPHKGEPIDDDERARIIGNLQRALEQASVDLQVVWPFGDRKSDGTWRWSTTGQAGRE